MAKKLNIAFDSELIESISADFDLRTPNKEALRQLIFTLDGDYNSDEIQVLNLATGVGKTYLMAAFIEYLHQQGVGNVVIVTPGKIVQAKTVLNFTPGNPRYIPGAQVPPDIITPQDYSSWVTRINGQDALAFGRDIPMLAFIFNIQQLIAPKSLEGETLGATQDAERRKPRRFDENAGVLFDYLKGLDDLVVIADESHLYSSSAVAFSAALKELNPAATIGLTASVLPEDHVIYEYPLYRALQDKYVKSPVLAFRKGGYGNDVASEEQQLRDALQLRRIKQAFYDSYTLSKDLPHFNAVLFVVCSDVDHATQVAELLRTPEFLGKGLAVLQVDSKHDDDTTQRLLQNLDEQDSPVLAVVSVNKLKEGWDVKNIAVVVTLRAMASEVLTQQTMGRGLRLPFGGYTGVQQIDQLDIISHQSFRELLEAENVLSQFGLEEAVSQANRGLVDDAIRKVIGSGTGPLTGADQGVTDGPMDKLGQGSTTSHSVGQKQKDDIGPQQFSVGLDGGITTSAFGSDTKDEDEGTETTSLTMEPVIISRNSQFENISYKFPVSIFEVQPPVIDLSEISDKIIDEAARKVTSAGDVMYRKEIVAALGKKLRAVDVESAEVDSLHVDTTDAANVLVKLIANFQLIPSTKSTLQYIETYLVPKFMKNVPFEEWTIKSLDSARNQLQTIVKEYVAGVQRAVKVVPSIKPVQMKLNGYVLPLGEKVYEPIETRDQFVRNRVYSGWFKSLFEEEYFDSYSGEYELARLLNISPHIVWWHRLHPQDGAFIYYTAKDRYYPDFVAQDDEGIYWIIEAKNLRGRDDKIVQAKRKAAEALVRRLAAEESFDGQYWGYLIAYEDDIAFSDTWNDLKSVAQPVTNKV